MSAKVSIVVFYRKHPENIEFIMFPRIGSNLLEFPGGKIENNETYLECALREIHEEVNLVLDPLKCFFYDISSHFKFKIATYLYEYDFDQRKGIKLHSVDKNTMYFPEDITLMQEIEKFVLK